jgi:hypothetical protein
MKFDEQFTQTLEVDRDPASPPSRLQFNNFLLKIKAFLLSLLTFSVNHSSPSPNQ